MGLRLKKRSSEVVGAKREKRHCGESTSKGLDFGGK
jgi:hypothetical protein